MTNVCDICGSSEVVMIKPGQEAVWSDDRDPRLPRFIITRPAQDEFRCWDCIPRRTP